MFFLTGGLALRGRHQSFMTRAPAWLVKHSARELGGVCGRDLVMPPFFVHCGDSHAVFSFPGASARQFPCGRFTRSGGQAGGGAFAGDGGAGEPAVEFEPSKMSLYCNTLQAIARLLELSIRWCVVVRAVAGCVLVMKFIPVRFWGHDQDARAAGRFVMSRSFLEPWRFLFNQPSQTRS